jgi:GST-like protein
VQDYKNVIRWTDQIAARPAVKRGRMVNRTFGDPASQLADAMTPAISRPGRLTSW